MLPNWLSLVDLAFVGIALLFAWGGAQKGFASQITHIITCLIMAVFFFFVYPYIISYLGRVFRDLNPHVLMWLVLIGAAVLAIAIFLFCTQIMAGILDTDVSPRTDSVAGSILGFIRGALVATYAMIFLVILGPPRCYDSFRMKSYVGKAVCYEIVPRIQPELTRAALDERVRDLQDKLLDREEAGKHIQF